VTTWVYPPPREQLACISAVLFSDGRVCRHSRCPRRPSTHLYLHKHRSSQRPPSSPTIAHLRCRAPSLPGLAESPSPPSQVHPPRHPQCTLMGSITDSCKFKLDGLIKKVCYVHVVLSLLSLFPIVFSFCIYSISPSFSLPSPRLHLCPPPTFSCLGYTLTS
jgi:hypothetical protein